MTERIHNLARELDLITWDYEQLCWQVNPSADPHSIVEFGQAIVKQCVEVAQWSKVDLFQQTPPDVAVNVIARLMQDHFGV
jgi:hypothetical protein